MDELPHELQAIAAGQRNLVNRRQLQGIGWSDTRTKAAVRQGWLRPLHPGVYLLGSAPPDWWQRLLAAVLAAGEGAFASHRAALLLWGLVSWTTSPIEISAPHNGQPRPSGVLLHRSRRTEPLSVVRGIQTSSVERTLLESATVVPPVVTEKAFSAAWRRNLTSPAKCELYLEHHGGKGRRGTTALREVVAIYAGTDRAAGSDGEVAFLRALRAAGVEEPVRQFEVTLPDGSKAVVDFAWPLRRNPEEVARRVIRFLGA